MTATSNPSLDLYRRAAHLARSGDKPAATEEFRRLLAQYPDHVPTLLWLVALSGDLSERLRLVERALALEPDSGVARRVLAQLRAPGGSASAA
jgi:hypothetical protein